MPRKKTGERSVKRERKTSQLLERGETPRADELPDPEVDGPSEITVDAPRQRDRARHSTGGTSGPGATRPRRKSDDSLASEIHEILTSDPELDATDIEVVVEGGAVSLSGEVEHPDAKLLAEELTESVAGVRLVHNRLVVRR